MPNNNKLMHLWSLPTVRVHQAELESSSDPLLWTRVEDLAVKKTLFLADHVGVGDEVTRRQSLRRNSACRCRGSPWSRKIKMTTTSSAAPIEGWDGSGLDSDVKLCLDGGGRVVIVGWRGESDWVRQWVACGCGASLRLATVRICVCLGYMENCFRLFLSVREREREAMRLKRGNQRDERMRKLESGRVRVIRTYHC